MITLRLNRVASWHVWNCSGNRFGNVECVRKACFTTSAICSHKIGSMGSCHTPRRKDGGWEGARFKQQVASLHSHNDDGRDYRKRIAPWLKFGEYEKGLLSHLSMFEILRALLVLQICSFDVIVEKSTQLLEFSKKFGNVAEYLVRKTFYDQFVGGEEEARMKQVVDLLHRRGLTLMVAPVLEEDVEDEKSTRNVYDENVNTLKSIARMTSSMDKDKPIVQLKLSAIMPAKTLELASGVIQESWNDTSKLARIVEEMSSKMQTSSTKSPWTFLSGLSKEDVEHFENGLRRADEYVQVASELGVKVLVDAEFYSCKNAISTIALALMAKYNGNGYVVGDTIQGYLKEAQFLLDTELEVIGGLLQNNWFGKIVRGAYMDRERYLAKKRGIESPICESYEETSVSYDRCVKTVLQCMSKNHGNGGGTSHLLIATHNEKSIRLAVEEMKSLGITNELASFAQIYGMADYLSTPLVNSNYKVYKSTPYGPLAKVVAYLARRASENRSVLKGAREERIMLRKELFSRIF